MKNDDDRITQLEELLAYQTKTTDELSEQVIEQWKRIDSLNRQVEMLSEQFLELEDQAGEGPPVTKPPHY